MPSFSEPEPEPQGLHFDKPIPRPLKSPTKTNDIRSRNRRREYLERNPKYFNNTEHELADTLLYDSLIRKFQTTAEREAEGKAKGYSGVLESSLLRGEARLADLKSSADAESAPESTKEFTTEADLSKTETKEEGLLRWQEFLTERFVRGHDEDFDYSLVDHNDEYDTMERRDAEEAWFDEEDPNWASDADEQARAKQGETGVQDF
ncbi:coiled-coil domain-containing protein [Colletotrichum tofieldiae]|uniref:Coiled-coil domain-containing protein n=1 Tax=Colletotrichum tofieldiae TaxID=708197 RepID=A0A161VDN9_9PEZI|nr:coiled-coil domain-containing protein [Colletotrichum tofieldiae]GKT66635.1 coiled-coil domain-containing protein [Colletotrichum tofieldiae]GKT71702.1 coiled-coil domain-containing protein [Colletotrichum tofieldiae]GKT95131.1 coiled-coil domain-containing protein [Colletotrichum tofieldiae]